MIVTLKKLLFGENKPLLPRSSPDGYNATDDNSSSFSSMMSYEGVSNPRVVSDVIIGLSDGLTVPFALTAGLSSLGDSKLVITGGMAELVSGAISMGLGGFLAAKSEAEYFEGQLVRERQNYEENPESIIEDIHEALSEYKISTETIKVMVADLERNDDILSHFMVKVVRGCEEPATDREFTSALTIGLSYFFGGFVPLIPYFFAHVVETGFIASCILMAVTLFLFGWVKTIASLGTDVSYHQRWVNGFSMLFTGGFAAGAAWALVRVIE